MMMIAITTASLVFSSAPAITSAMALAFASIITAFARTAILLVTPTIRSRWGIVAVATIAFLISNTLVVTPTILTIPIMPSFTPITAVLFAYQITTDRIVEQKDAEAGIVVVAKSTAVQFDVAEGVPIITIIIGIVTTLAVTAIFIVIIAVAGAAQADIVYASQQACPCRNEQRSRRLSLACHDLSPVEISAANAPAAVPHSNVYEAAVELQISTVA